MSKRWKIIPIIVVMLLLVLIGWRLIYSASALLTWTTPYDPKPGGKSVRVTAYELRYSTDSVVFFANPGSGTSFTPMPAPLDSGISAAVTVTGLVEDSRYWFAIRSVDASGNWSAWSNIPFKITPDLTAPPKVVDLR